MKKANNNYIQEFIWEVEHFLARANIDKDNLNGITMYTAHGQEDIPGNMAWLDSLPDYLDLCVGGSRLSECPEAYQIPAETLTVVLGEFI